MPSLEDTIGKVLVSDVSKINEVKPWKNEFCYVLARFPHRTCIFSLSTGMLQIRRIFIFLFIVQQEFDLYN
jgi:hypothetical protein